MNLKAAICSAVLLLSCSSMAGAGPIVDAAQQAEALQAQGKPVEAMQALDTAVQSLWTAGPLAFKKVVLVDSAGAMGVYAERTNRSFRPDETLKVYVEPIDFGYGGSGDQSKIGFKADLAIENTTGQVLTEVKDLFSVSADSAKGWREFGMTLAFGVPYLRPGDYVGRFTVHDQNSEKTGTFDVPFTVIAPAAASAAPSGSGSSQAPANGSGATTNP
jgi:hypothetical protein